MVGRNHIDFSAEQIARAEARVTYQREIVERHRTDREGQYSELAEELLGLMETRTTLLRERHRVLVASSVKQR